ncbi:putative ZDHHC-type palmitoyltransferase 6 [Callorhinchus milii]|uniref:putative ZDHHC-type palmitoyltransferase 6 n=1 Tax=Callorhinchus milii TaxID=7868 RepID=UPI001C3F5345|nr:putative ZDHHC-type palmitoyltransferase 6 [Callorhinchus milii]
MLPVAPQPHAAGFAEALQRGDAEACARWLHRDRAPLSARGWNGFTPLHHATYRGNKQLAFLFIDHGADLNVPSDAGETPFHFACRRGQLHIIHRMVKEGANVLALDDQGKSALHHAVCGGSIATIRYLEEMGRFSFRDTDKLQLTPLHMATITGNDNVVKYLLREARCPATATDALGMTPMHTAAHTGASTICLLFMRVGGFSVLHVRNKDGRTPIDLANQGSTYRHKETAKLLNKFSKKPQNRKPEEPIGLYYGSLLFPGISSSLVFLLASYFGNYGGIFSALSFAFLAKTVFFQYHRTSTLSRLPNPIYLGTFASGIFHSLYCFYSKILPELWPASLLLFAMTGLASLLLWMLKELLTRDPGRMEKSDCEPTYSTVTELVEANQNPSSFCIYCEIIQPEGAKHCKLCESCMVNFDHHCLFLMTCVAKSNRRLFVFFIMEVLLTHLVFAASALYSLWLRYGLELEVVSAVLEVEAWVLGLALMNLATAVWEMVLLKDQLDTISICSTTTFRDKTGAASCTWERRCKNVFPFSWPGRVCRTNSVADFKLRQQPLFVGSCLEQRRNE